METSDEPGQVIRRTEERMAHMIAYARVGTAPFVYIPLMGWHTLADPAIAAGCALAATAEAIWFKRRAWRIGDLRDPVLVWADVAFCVVLMVIGTRAAFPAERNVITTELIPFSLVAPAAIGLGPGLRWRSAAAIAALWAAWVGSVYPHFTLKLVSDLLGFVLWYVVSMLIGRELRTLAAATAEAQRAAERARRIVAEQDRQALIAQHRELAHREIHDHLLPIVDHVASSRPLDQGIARAARRGAERARRFIMDPRAGGDLAFEQLMEEVGDTFIDRGLTLTSIVLIDRDPPEEVREAIAAAAREALTNVLKHVGPECRVNLFVESDVHGVEVVVRDRGPGFDVASVRPGGGFLGTYAAVRRHGGACEVSSRPGAGTKVSIRWPEEQDER